MGEEVDPVDNEPDQNHKGFDQGKGDWEHVDGSPISGGDVHEEQCVRGDRSLGQGVKGEGGDKEWFVVWVGCELVATIGSPTAAPAAGALLLEL